MSLMGMSKHDLAERILARSIPVPESGCWLWEGTTDPKGYGSLSIKDDRYRAHRISYLAFIGDPGSLFVCHKCDVPGCVNPKHLFLGTHSDNMIDSVRKRRHRSSRKTQCPKGHPLIAHPSESRRYCPICTHAINTSERQKRNIQRWEAEHTERRAELAREWAQKNRERRRESDRAYRQRNLEKRRAQSREYYHRNKDI